MAHPVNNAVFCPDISCTIQLTSFVEVNIPNHVRYVVCQLHGISHLPDGSIKLKMQKYPFASVDDPVLHCGGYYVNHSAASYPANLLQEVYVSKEFFSCYPSDISSICFNYTLDQLQQPKFHWCAGMHHVFFVRHVSMSEEQYRLGCHYPVPAKHNPYPRQLKGITYHTHKRVWAGLFHLYQELSRLLHCRSEKQGLFTKRSKTISFFSNESFNFILTSCSDIVPRRNFSVCKSNPVTESGMSRRRVKGPLEDATLIRFETKEQLKELVMKVFRVTGRFGIRTCPPKLAETEGVSITENAAINYIEGSDHMTLPIKMRTNKDGVDLIYTCDGHLKISVRYRRYLLHYDVNGTPLNCPCEVLMDMLMHFPKQHSRTEDSDNVDLHTDNDDDTNSNDDGNKSLASEVNSTGEDAIQRDNISIVSVCSDESNISSELDPSSSSVDSLASLLNTGSCFHLNKQQSVWKIMDITKSVVMAEVINLGRDATLEKGETKHFQRTNKKMRVGLKEFNQC